MTTNCGYCNTPIEDSTAMYDPVTDTYLHIAGNSPGQIIGTILGRNTPQKGCIGNYIKKSTLEGKSVCLNPVNTPPTH